MIYEQNRSNIVELQALTAANKTAIYRFNRSYGLDKYGILWKAGLATNFSKILFGLTVTTPVIGIKGKGNYKYEEFLSGSEGVVNKDDIYTTDSQSELPVTIKRPWAIGAGITIPIKKSKIHLSGKWYGRVPNYEMIQTNDHIK